MEELERFRKDADSHEACSLYSSRWDSCVSNRELFALACEVQAAEYLAKALSEGWGVSAEYIASRFKDYVNGRYVANLKTVVGHGYTSAIYSAYKGDVDTDLSMCTFLGCDARVRIAENSVCRIITDKDSCLEIYIPASSSAVVATYSDAVMIDGTGKGRYKIIKLG